MELSSKMIIQTQFCYFFSGRQGGLCSTYLPLDNEQLFTDLSKHQPVRETFNTGVITLCSEGKVYN